MTTHDGHHDTLPTLTPTQDAAVTEALHGHNILLTGPGGTGKSVTVQALERQSPAPILMTASTGIAALQIGGTTIHSTLGTGLSQCPADLKPLMLLAADDPDAYSTADFSTIDKAERLKRRIASRFGASNTLLIDEVSMLSGDYLEMMDTWLQYVLDSDEPMGGVQLILSGDFLQLPPVERRDERTLVYPMAFDAPVWNHLHVKPFELTQSFRQSDQRLVDALNALRYGEEIDQRLFAPCVGRTLTNPLRLVGTNAVADRINTSYLTTKPGDPVAYRTTYWQEPHLAGRYALDSLKRNVLCPEVLILKPGVPVLLLRNDYDEGYRNGSRGIYLGPDQDEDGDFLRVALSDGGGTEVKVRRHVWEWKQGRDLLATLEQYPMRLGWAITIHKSQGMTLSNVEVDLSRIFAPGQLYVALSRVTDLEGLSLTQRIEPGMLQVHPRAIEFYRKIRAQSAISPVPADASCTTP